MEMNPYAVLVRTDAKNRITEINSSAFVDAAEGWIKIAEGRGDKFHHAQGNYLPKPLMDERGVYRYKLEEGQTVERTKEEMEADYAARPVPATPKTNAELEAENALLKAQVQAVAERNEFVENCIAEMAAVVYAETE